MKQNPSRLKHKKNHRADKSFFFLFERKHFFPLNGTFALQCVQSGHLTFKQIEAGRRAIRRTLKKEGFLTVCIFTGRSVTSKPIASRMGKGKGTHSFWMCPVKKGKIIFEVSGVSKNYGFRALKKASIKMPVKTKVVTLSF
jgi:large subunit ribosomal protein L16